MRLPPAVIIALFVGLGLAVAGFVMGIYNLPAATTASAAVHADFIESVQTSALPGWLASATGYQLLVRSFYDTNGDGYGDLAGVSAKLDYLENLGVNLVWFNPVYNSTNYDWGYDVTNFTSIHPDYGTLAQFDALVVDMHARGMRVLQDLVPGHTSIAHPWFIASETNATGPYADYYLWIATNSTTVPPTADIGAFGTSVWTYSATRGAWYFHAFGANQPSLNYATPAVHYEMANVIQFWLNRGVDGFRVDVGGSIQPEPARVYAIENMRAVVDLYPDRVLLNEDYDNTYLSRDPAVLLPLYAAKTNINYLQLPTYFSVVVPANKRYHSNFNFAPLLAASIGGDKFHLAPAITGQQEYAETFKAAPLTTASGNHDVGRIASAYRKYAGTQLGTYAYRAYLGLLFMSRMTPFLAYGDELGMLGPELASLLPLLPTPAPPVTQALVPWQTPVTGADVSTFYIPRDSAFNDVFIFGARDTHRTPMQWTASGAGHAGFTSGTPWLPVPLVNLSTINVAAQVASNMSTHRFVQTLMTLRRTVPGLGGLASYAEVVDSRYPELMIVYRGGPNSYMMLANLGTLATVANPMAYYDASCACLRFPGDLLTSSSVLYNGDFLGKLMISNYMDRIVPATHVNQFVLRPFEFVVFDLH